MGVPPGARVIVTPTTMTVVVVGTAMITVLPAETKVSETAPEDGAGFGSEKIRKLRITASIQMTVPHTPIDLSV
jgi:hypothetical protein